MENNTQTDVRNLFKTTPDFDLYSHLKSNIKNNMDICEIHDSKLTTYCIGCRRPICEVCRDSFHSSHQFIEKKDFLDESKTIIEMVFKDLEKRLDETEIFVQPKRTLVEVQAKVSKEFDHMIERLNELKIRRLRELEGVFGIQTHEAMKVNRYMKKTKDLLVDFIEQNKNFYCFNDIEDTDNFSFLTIYDFLNETDIITKGYLDTITNIKNQFRRYETLINNKYCQKIQASIDECLEEQKKLEVANSNMLVLETPSCNSASELTQTKVKRKFNSGKVVDCQDEFKNSLAYCYDKLSEDNYESLRAKLKQVEDHIDEFRNNIFESFKKNGTLIEIEKMLKIYEEKTSKRVQYNSQVNSVKMSNSKGSGLSRSKQSLKLVTVKSPDKPKQLDEIKGALALNLVSSIKEEDENHKDNDDSQVSFENKDEQIDVGISKNKKLFENKELLRINNMFKPKQKPQKKENNSNRIQYLPNKADESADGEKYKNKLAEILKENKKLLDMIKSKNDCNMKIPTIKKFFSYSILEFIRKNFYKSYKGQASEMIFSNELEKNAHSDDIVKVFEGTNEIQIYDRTMRKIIRKPVKIDKKKFGTTVFPNGCRTYYCIDKLYVSGGKDINGEKKSFWSYNVKDDKLEKLIDMNTARSFHTMVYHENLRSLMVFGGENNQTCEMYDFYLNLWSPLPDMNFKRANVQIYLDKVGTFGYALCGITGSITNPSYSDQIELLDLVDMNHGWAIVDYNNKSNVDLKMNENKVYPLTDDKLLIYGANENRSINKVYCIFDLRTFIMQTIDEEELGDFKIHSILNPTKSLEKAFNKTGLSK